MRRLFTFTFLCSVLLGFTTENTEKEPLYIMGYPRSGSNWVRYFLEFVTARPSYGVVAIIKPELQKDYGPHMPIGYERNIPIDESLAPIVRLHSCFDMEYCAPILNKEGRPPRIILLVRDFKEAILRHLTPDYIAELDSIELLGEVSYFNLLNYFDNQPEDSKLLIYYEDLIKDPRAVMEKINTFSGGSVDKMNSFFENYALHKEECLAYYDKYYEGSYTRGNFLAFHANKMKKELVDQWIEEVPLKYPKLSQKYLQRYLSK